MNLDLKYTHSVYIKISFESGNTLEIALLPSKAILGNNLSMNT